MNRASFFAVAASAAALSLSTPVAMAASHASASIGNLNFTLIDLNPYDGIAPSMSFLTTGGNTALSVSASDTALGESESAARTRPGTFSFSREFLAELTHGGAGAAIDQSQLWAEGHGFGVSTSFNAAASTGGGYSLALSAHSAVLITAHLGLVAEASNGSCSSYYYYCSYYPSDVATASGSLSLSYSYSANGVYVSYNQADSQSLTAVSYGGYQDYSWIYNPETGGYEQVWYTYPGTEESKTFEGMLSATFTNMTQSTQTAALGLSVGVQGQGSSAPLPSPVPEPGTVTLVSVGLLAAGAAARAGSAGVSPVPEAEGWTLGLAGLATVLALGRRRARP